MIDKDFLLIAIIIGVVTILIIPLADSAIPPTRAIERITTSNDTVRAFNASANVNLVGSGITITGSNDSKTVYFTVSVGGGNVTFLNDAGDVALTSPTEGSLLQLIAGFWEDIIFKANTITCSAGQFFNSFDNQTGIYGCGTPSGGGGGITSVSNTDPNADAKLVYSNSSTTANIKGLNGTVGQIAVANGTISAIISLIPKMDTTTCSGTDKFSAYDNATGDYTCSTDVSGGGGGSGIPKPTPTAPKKWGQFNPSSTTTAFNGLLQSGTLTQDGTETFVYNPIEMTNAINSTTGGAANANAGFDQSLSGSDVFRRDQNAYMFAKFATNTTNNRLLVGFRAGTIEMPNANDNILTALNGVGVCLNSTSTQFQLCYNDGVGNTEYVTLGVNRDNLYHEIEVYAEASNNRWCATIDGGTAVCASTNIPSATQRMYVNVECENTSTLKNHIFSYALVYVQIDN